MDDELTGTLWSLDPDTRAALRLDRVRRAMERQEWDTAIVEVEEFLDEEPQHPEALFLLGESLLEVGDPALALEVYEDHARLTGGSEPSALLGLAIARFETCDLPGAAQAAREVVRQSTDNAEAHYTLGLALERLPGRSVEAVSAFSAAANLDPDSYPLPLQLRTDEWHHALEVAITDLHPTLRAFWSGIPMRLEELPELAELRAHDPPLSPTVTALYTGDPPSEDDTRARPDALRLYTRNLARAGSWEGVVEQLHLALQQEALDWLGLSADEL